MSPSDNAGSAPSPPVLEVDHLVKEFRLSTGKLIAKRFCTLHAVSDVSFEVASAETFGLVGESGSGKTTLARMVIALETPTSGEVRVGGVALTSLSRSNLRTTRRMIQPVFQDSFSSLNPRMRVGDVIAEPLVAQHVGNRAQRQTRVGELLGEVGLNLDSARRYPHELSGGQRQRVALARALALRPQLIVADEPVSALDVSVRAQILNLMNELKRSHGLTYLFISHDLSVVRYMADRIGVVYLGKLVEIGRSADVYNQPAHRYTAALIRAVPTIDTAGALASRGYLPSADVPSPLKPPSGCRYRTRCERAEDLCTLVEPPLQVVGTGHLAACHFPLESGETRSALP